MATYHHRALYDFLLWIFSVCFDIFFRQILPRGAYRIPRTGPVIFVGAPHSNQFVDPMLLMQQVRYNAGRRISFLIAEVSFRHFLIGPLARMANAIPVVRAQDNLKPAKGTIFIKEQAPADKQQHVFGKGTRFTSDCVEKGLIGIPKLGNAEILEIKSDEELVLRKPFKPKTMEALKNSPGGLAFKTAGHVDQSLMYHHVFSHLQEGHCLGIFPEGGSHDRSDLLPLKAGVAIMALGAIAADPNCNVRVVPCGMNYFHAHKFRSRAVIEFGAPINIDPSLVEAYKKGGEPKRQAVKEVLDMITVGLKSVTVTAPDFDTLMVVQAGRRLYRPSKRKLPLPVQVEMTRRLIEGYKTYKDLPEVQHLVESVRAYNRKLSDMGIKDHSVEGTDKLNPLVILGIFLFRLFKLVIMALLALPGTILFSPVFIATKQYSKRKARAALKASTVKIKANDVIATWKVLVAICFAPLLYTAYAVLSAYIVYKNNWIEQRWSSFAGVIICSYIVFPSLTYSALVIGETGVDIAKSLRPLIVALDYRHRDALQELKNTREELVVEISEVINQLGPKVFPDFDSRQDRLFGIERAERRHQREASEASETGSDKKQRSLSISSNDSHGLSRVASSNDISSVPVFSNWQGDSSPSIRSRASSSSSITSLSSDDKDVSLATGREDHDADVIKRIRGAMSEVQKARQQEE